MQQKTPTRTKKAKIVKAPTKAKSRIGRPTFNVKNVSAGHRELRLWLTLGGISNLFFGQRAVLLGLYHQALGFSKELPTIQKYVALGKRRIDKHYADQTSQTQEFQLLEGHVDRQEEYAYLVESMSHRAAESMVYTIDSLIKNAGTRAGMECRKGKFLLGGRYIAKDLTLLEGFRVVANWQRHHIEWWNEPYNPANFNHAALHKMGLWDRKHDVPIRFLKFLANKTYFTLERDLHEALEYMICEMGMRHPSPEWAIYDRENSDEAITKRADEYVKNLKRQVGRARRSRPPSFE